MSRRLAAAIASGILAVLALPVAANADLEDEQALAERYAPVVRLVEQQEECGPGEPYEPTDVDVLFGDRTVALRGPWNRHRPREDRPDGGRHRRSLRVPPRLPGERARPGLRLRALGAAASRRAPSRPSTPTSRREPGDPGKLALQYWFFYPFNDFNNKHEGDWEMIQLVFDADDAAAALAQTTRSRSATARTRAPSGRTGTTTSSRSSTARTRSSIRRRARTRTSSRDGALPRQLRRGGRRLRRHAGPAPRAPAGRSGRSRATRRRPAAAFPWIAFEGRWGELQKAFFNGPTGPEPEGRSGRSRSTWSEDWRDRSYAVPTGGVCSARAPPTSSAPAVERGSAALTRLLRNPLPRRSRPCARPRAARLRRGPGDLDAGRPAAGRHGAARGDRSSRPPPACT